MLTGLPDDTPWPDYRDVLGWVIRRDVGRLMPRLGCTGSAAPAKQDTDIVAFPRARTSVVAR